MIVSPASRALFVHVQKTGGRTIENLLLAHLPDAEHVRGLPGGMHATLTAHYLDRALPLKGSYSALCRDGKVVLGGDALLTLSDVDGRYLGSGDGPIGWVPLGGGGGWNVGFVQTASAGATTADITIEAICATVAP